MTEGTRPDMWSYRDLPADAPACREIIQAMVNKAKSDGATHCRVTLVDKNHKPAKPIETTAGVWLEGWNKRPDREAAFDPPLTHVKETTGEAATD